MITGSEQGRDDIPGSFWIGGHPPAFEKISARNSACNDVLGPAEPVECCGEMLFIAESLGGDVAPVASDGVPVARVAAEFQYFVDTNEEFFQRDDDRWR